MTEGRGTAHGRVPVFVGDDFELFSEQLGCYFHANDVDDEGKRKSILLASLSTEHYRLLSDLVAPDKPSDDGLSFQNIVEKMKTHMAPEKSLQLARYQFDHLAKGAEERVADFVARVKHSAAACKFTAEERPARLRDRFISGLQDAKMVAAILRMRGVDVTFDSAVGTASAVEQTLTDVRAIAGQDVMSRSSWGMSADPGVHAMTQVPQVARASGGAGRGRAPQRGRTGSEVDFQGCWGCGGPHLRRVCPYKNTVCLHCHKVGHLKRVCRMAGASVGVLDGEVREDPSDLGSGLQPGHSDAGGPEQEMQPMLSLILIGPEVTRPITVEVEVNGEPIVFYVDTGAAVSVMGERAARSLRGVCLVKTTLSLCMYTGEAIAPLAVADVSVVYRGKSTYSRCLWYEGRGPPFWAGTGWRTSSWSSSSYLQVRRCLLRDPRARIWRQEPHRCNGSSRSLLPATMICGSGATGAMPAVMSSRASAALMMQCAPVSFRRFQRGVAVSPLRSRSSRIATIDDKQVIATSRRQPGDGHVMWFMGCCSLRI
uniref:CCHC-type domain-containing protein n=1 Tax=Eptatretus burgeri TaxID=7764 RepID=A0A8C4PYU4_EPTBU